MAAHMVISSSIRIEMKRIWPDLEDGEDFERNSKILPVDFSENIIHTTLDVLEAKYVGVEPWKNFVPYTSVKHLVLRWTFQR